MLDFFKGSTDDFDQKLHISSSFVLGKMGLEVVFDDYIDRKQALLDYKNMDFT